jgi:hypothetical protein
MSEHEPASRSVALEAVISVAIDKARSSRYRRTVASPRVAREAEGETSDRTIRRAMKDAEALGWIQKKNYGNEYEAGPKAEQLVDE